ncbi:hypothetical protein ACLOJK_037103 [Asimina triloba]
MGSGALVLRSTIPLTTRRRDTGVVPLARQTAIFGPCGLAQRRSSNPRRRSRRGVSTTCCTSRPDDDARSYGRRKLARTFVATGPDLAHTAARLRGSPPPPDFAGPSRDGAGRDARNGTRSDNPMGQAAKKKDAGVQHDDFPGALRRWTARRQYSGPAGWPSGGAIAQDIGPIAPFPTTCCTSRPDDDARSYGRWKLARTLIATGPELAHTAARLRGSDFAGPSRDGAGCDDRNGTRSDNPMGSGEKKGCMGATRGLPRRSPILSSDEIRCISAGMIAPVRLALDNSLNHTAPRQYSGPAGWPSGGAATHHIGPVAPFPTTCCTSRPDDDARSYRRRKLARTFVATGPELAHTAARLRGSDFAAPSRDGAGRDSRNGTRSENPMGQAAKKKDAGVQHEDFPGGHPS